MGTVKVKRINETNWHPNSIVFLIYDPILLVVLAY